MRLIDADAFERKVMCGDEEDVQDVIYSLRDFPTAYDIDKVVKQLEEWSFESKILVPVNNELGEYEEEVEREVICTKNAVDIVKGGGVNE